MPQREKRRRRMKKEEAHLKGTKRKTVRKLIFGRNSSRYQSKHRGQLVRLAHRLLLIHPCSFASIKAV